VVTADRKRARVVGGGYCGGFGPADPLQIGDAWPTGGELPLELD
jgi:hypothetical protein